MKLAVVAPSPVPFTFGGAERAWQGITRAINEHSEHGCELLKLPSPERDLAELVRSYDAFLRLDVGHFDRIITSKYPAWMVDHPDELIYLFHRLRGLYDTYPAHLPPRADIRDRELAPVLRLLRTCPTRQGAFDVLALLTDLIERRAGDPALAHPGPVGRELVHYLDAVGFGGPGERAYAALSRSVARRPDYFPPGADVDIVELPADLDGLHPQSYEHFFTASRLDGPKRLDLLIAAYRKVPGDTPLLIAGTGPEEERLRALAAADHRIRFLGFVSDTDLADLYNRALAVPFVPLEEDWGLVAVESMSSATPVITCTDSGGPADLVTDGTDGFVVEPSPSVLAAAMTRLVEDPGLAERLGEAGLERAKAITWEGVVRRLTSGRERRVRRAAGERRRPATPQPAPLGTENWRTGKPKLVVLSTFVVHPAIHGGQLRCWHLYRNLREHFDVELLCLGSIHDRTATVALEPGLLQRAVNRTTYHHQLEVGWDFRIGLPVGDIVAGMYLEHSPDFVVAAKEALADADVALLAHPFLLEAVELLRPDLPFVYDAHNVEVALKSELIGSRPGGAELVDRVEEIEGRAVTGSIVRSACSPEDAADLAERYGVPVESILVVPNGVDVAATPFVTGEERHTAGRRYLDRYRSITTGTAEHLAVFFGSWHPPNIEAAKHLVRMAPRLPEVLLVLAGEHTSDLPRFGLPRNLAPAGRVSDRVKSVLLRAATVGLNPVATGSGTNLKLVEYMAAGLPVVSTPTGARGLPVEDGVHLRLAPLHTFADAIREVATSESRDAMAAAGRALVEERYDWARLGPLLANAIVDALS